MSAPTTVHRMTALEDSDVFEVSTPELDDVVRLEDRYGREDGRRGGKRPEQHALRGLTGLPIRPLVRSARQPRWRRVPGWGGCF